MCDNAHLYFARICCFFKLQKRSHSAIPLDVWVPSKLDREAISGCLQLPCSCYLFGVCLKIFYLRLSMFFYCHFYCFQVCYYNTFSLQDLSDVQAYFCSFYIFLQWAHQMDGVV